MTSPTVPLHDQQLPQRQWSKRRRQAQHQHESSDKVSVVRTCIGVLGQSLCVGFGGASCTVLVLIVLLSGPLAPARQLPGCPAGRRHQHAGAHVDICNPRPQGSTRPAFEAMRTTSGDAGRTSGEAQPTPDSGLICIVVNCVARAAHRCQLSSCSATRFRQARPVANADADAQLPGSSCTSSWPQTGALRGGLV
jgi:hypothetical protein